MQWNQPERGGVLGVALTAAEAAAAIIRARSGDTSSLEWRVKSPADFVSDVDNAAEDAIRAVLARDCPGATIMAEEGSPDARGDGLVFVVDPLDGTTNFLHGYPAYSVSIGVLDGGVPAAAVVVNAVNGDVFTARAGEGAYRNGKRIHVSEIDEPPLSLIGTGFPFKNLDRLDLYQHQFAHVVRGTAGVRRAGSAALDLADVACGRFEGFWELSLMPWDFTAGAMLIQEAGGIVTDLEGGKAPLAQSSIVAGNPAMHAWLLRTLAA